MGFGESITRQRLQGITQTSSWEFSIDFLSSFLTTIHCWFYWKILHRHLLIIHEMTRSSTNSLRCQLACSFIYLLLRVYFKCHAAIFYSIFRVHCQRRPTWQPIVQKLMKLFQFSWNYVLCKLIVTKQGLSYLLFLSFITMEILIVCQQHVLLFPHG